MTKKNPQAVASADVPAEVLRISALWIAKATPEELMSAIGCASRVRALGTIVNYRKAYGKELFPYRKKAVAEGGYSKQKVLKLSKLWKSGCSAEAFAAAAGLHSPKSMYGTVQHLRNKFKDVDEDLFPVRN